MALYEVGVEVWSVKVMYCTGCLIGGCATETRIMAHQRTDKDVGRGS